MSTGDDIAVVVLAAGKGSRMRSSRSKVLHEIAGRPMLHFPLGAAEALAPERLVVVVGREAAEVESAFAGRATFVHQSEQRGTGHAVLAARAALEGFEGCVLILYADGPLIRPETLQRMVAHRRETGAELVMLTADTNVPGIVVRDAQGAIERIVEDTDATDAELSIRERNTGVYLVEAKLLWETLAQVGDENAQGEIYLTTIIELAVRQGRKLEALRVDDGLEAMGVNDRVELAKAAAEIRRRVAQHWMREGVTIVDPDQTYIDVDVTIGPDTLIEPGCVIQGSTRIGRGVHIKPHCTIESSVVGDDCVIGPSAHLRPDSVLGDGVRIGNFVEVKNSNLGAGVKADHLSYIGDSDVGAGASFGCGAIVVNYDGIAKHRTVVGERAFVGCNANLIAPVRLEHDSFVAAGSTVTGDVPAQSLAIARAEQENIEGWVSRRAKRAAAEARRQAAKPKTGADDDG